MACRIGSRGSSRSIDPRHATRVRERVSSRRGRAVAGAGTRLPGLLAGESLGVIEQALETPQPSFLTSITPLASATDAVESKPDAFPIAQVVKGAVELHSHPGGGEVLAEIGTTTEFGSPQTLGVTERRGDWLAVVTTELPNGQVGWIDLAAGRVELTSTPLLISIDLREESSS